VPLYRNHVFAQIKPATQTCIGLGLALGPIEAEGCLIDTGGFARKDRITRRIPIASLAEIACAGPRARHPHVRRLPRPQPRPPPPLRRPPDSVIIRHRPHNFKCSVTDRRTAVRDALVAALAECAGSLPSRRRMRRFLTGLSFDELQFIAAHLGFRILDPCGIRPRPWTAQPRQIVPGACTDAGMTARQSHDLEHKLILLVEFLGRSGMRHAPPRAAAAHWN